MPRLQQAEESMYESLFGVNIARKVIWTDVTERNNHFLKSKNFQGPVLNSGAWSSESDSLGMSCILPFLLKSRVGYRGPLQSLAQPSRGCYNRHTMWPGMLNSERIQFANDIISWPSGHDEYGDRSYTLYYAGDSQAWSLRKEKKGKDMLKKWN